MDLRELPAGSFARHPWETARAGFLLGIPREHLQSPASALDVGAGGGCLARRLLSELPGPTRVTCSDTGYGPEWLKKPPESPPGLDFARAWPRETLAWFCCSTCSRTPSKTRGYWPRPRRTPGRGAGPCSFTSLLVRRALAKGMEAVRGSRATSIPGGRQIETLLRTWHHGPMLTWAVKRLLDLDARGGRITARWGLPLPGLSAWVLARRP